MRVYRVRPDVNNYQYFMLNDAKLGMSDMMKFDCRRISADWVPPDVFIMKPKHNKGNFPCLWATPSLTVDGTAMNDLQDLLEMSGELLPLPYMGALYHVLNVTECVNVLDDSKTQWLYEPGSGPIKKYAFRRDRFTESPLFKIPESCTFEILTIEGMKDPEYEFKGRVENCGLKGLVFEELWSDSQ